MQSLADSGCQTDMIEALLSPVVSPSVSITPEIESAYADKIIVPEDSDETEAMADPKFDVRPIDIEVAEGDPVKFKCMVSGTQPIGNNNFIINNFVKFYDLIYPDVCYWLLFKEKLLT